MGNNSESNTLRHVVVFRLGGARRDSLSGLIGLSDKDLREIEIAAIQPAHYRCQEASADIHPPVDIPEIEAIFVSNLAKLKDVRVPIKSLTGTVNRETVLEILANPDYLYRMSPHDFEVFVAEIYRGLGYQVSQTKKTRDGGVDLFIEKTIDGMRHHYIVQCKHTQKKRKKIGVSFIRDLMGVIIDKTATAGILVTNALFSRDALEFANRHASRLFCVDVFDLRKLMLRYLIATV
jgi:restriction endonuclease Mrr